MLNNPRLELGLLLGSLLLRSAFSVRGSRYLQVSSLSGMWASLDQCANALWTIAAVRVWHGLLDK